MKKLLLLLSSCFVLGTIYGQIPNASFESWNSTPYDEPTGFETGNRESVSLGLIPITRVNGTSGYAVRMETLVNNGDTAMAYIANGDPMQGYGGIPFAEQPTAITGYYRYSLPANDTALILLMFKKNGNIISSDIFKIKGTGTQNTFTSFSFPINLPMTPDSVIFAATSSNLIDNIGVESGSFMEIDGIAFTGTTAQIDNGSFENWTTQNNDALIGWQTYGEGFAKTTDSYNGTSAVQFTTIEYGNGDISSSGMTCGQFTNNGPNVGGFPYTLQTDTLTGYYKYIASNDSANVSVSLSYNSNNVGGAGSYLPPAPTYTYFEIPFYSGQVPDTMRIDFSSSKWPYGPSSVGSTLFIDQLQLKSELLAGIKNVNGKRLVVSYPNPATEKLYIRMVKNISENVYVEVFDMTGKLILADKKNPTDNMIELNTSSLKSGTYFYRVYTNDGPYEQMFTRQ